MLRQIASLSALALTAAPMIALNANMAMAGQSNSNDRGQVTFFNQGGYVAEYELSYVHNGNRKKYKTGRMVVGKQKTYLLPAGSKNVRVRGQAITGLFWEPTRVMFDKTYRKLSSEKCFKTYGTIFKTGWNSNCKAAF